MIQAALAGLFFFGILTLWVPAYWPVTVFQVGVYALAGVYLWRAHRFSFRLSYPVIPLSLAVGCGVFQIAGGFTTYRFDTLNAVLRWATFLCVFLIASNLFRDSATAHGFRNAMLWFASGIAALATVQTFTSGGKVFWLFQTPYPDVMGPILSANHFAVFIEAVLPVAVYLALRREHERLLYSGMAATMFASVIASGSRAGTVLATAEVLAVMALVWLRRKVPGRAVGAALLRMALLFMVFSAVVGWQHVWERLWAPDPMAVRREFRISTIEMIKAHPVIGVGLGAWPTAYPRFAIVDVGSRANQAHNDWLQWTAEGGIPLGIALVTLLLWSLWPAFRSVWGIGLVAVFLHAFVDYPFSRPALGSWPILIMGMLAAERKLSGALWES